MRTAAAVLLSLMLAIPVLGAVRDEPQPSRATTWTTVEVSDQGPSGSGGIGRPRDPIQPAGDVRASAGPVRPMRSPITVPSPHLLVVDLKPVAPSVQRVAGTASWYCGHGSPCTRGYPGGLYAAAGPALRIGAWRGRSVIVRAAGATVRVRLIDWCACPNGRVLDLYSDAFRRLAPLSQGVVSVTVSW